MKCSNCESAAIWVYQSESVAPLPYCDAHLPAFLRAAAKSGSLAKAEGYAAVEAEVAEALAPVVEEAPAPKRSRKKAEEPVVEEPVVEEAVEAEPSVEEPVEG